MGDWSIKVLGIEISCMEEVNFNSKMVESIRENFIEEELRVLVK